MTELAIANVSPDPAIRNTSIGSPPHPPLIRDIIRLVAIYYRTTPQEITGVSRRKVALRPRFMAIYLAHRFTGKSSVFIGRFMGGRDHTSILNALRRMDTALARSPKLASQYRDLSQTLIEEYGL